MYKIWRLRYLSSNTVNIFSRSPAVSVELLTLFGWEFINICNDNKAEGQQISISWACSLGVLQTPKEYVGESRIWASGLCNQRMTSCSHVQRWTLHSAHVLTLFIYVTAVWRGGVGAIIVLETQVIVKMAAFTRPKMLQSTNKTIHTPVLRIMVFLIWHLWRTSQRNASKNALNRFAVCWS
jgi:hypothetical protein